MAQARLGVRKAIRDVTKTGRSQRASRSVRAKRKRYLGDGMIEQRSCSQLAVDKSSEVHCKALEELRRRSSQSSAVALSRHHFTPPFTSSRPFSLATMSCTPTPLGRERRPRVGLRCAARGNVLFRQPWPKEARRVWPERREARSVLRVCMIWAAPSHVNPARAADLI